jgi:hypothetical protein
MAIKTKQQITTLNGTAADDAAAPLEAIGVSGHLEWLIVKDLRIDPRYQRDLSPLYVRRIVREFDPDAFGVIIVSERSDRHAYIVDGQHRIAALKEMGWEDQLVPCLVYRDLSIENEAKAFYKPQSTRRAMTPANRFKARLMAGDPSAIEVKATVERAGYMMNYRTGSSPDTREIDAVHAIEYLYRVGGVDHLHDVLSIVRAAWGTDDFKIPGTFLTGLSGFLRRYENRYDRARVIHILRGVLPIRIEANSKQLMSVLGGTREDAVGRAILRLYNTRLQLRRLPEWDTVTSRR